MTEKEAELAIMAALSKCADGADCEGCPLYAEANDESCALYVMAIARNPERYEKRGGVVAPMKGGDAR